MSIKLTPAEREHSRNPELIEALLNTTFNNENYDIVFELKSPNVVRGTFTSKKNGVTYEANFGLPENSHGDVVRAESCADIKPFREFGYDEDEHEAFLKPDFQISSTEIIEFLNQQLILIQDFGNLE